MTFREYAIVLQTFFDRDVMRIFRIWRQILLPPAISSLLYFLIFGTLIGSRVGDIGGMPYISFIIPGLMLMNMIMSSFTNSIFLVYTAKFQRSIEELLVSPVPSWLIIVGLVMGSVVRSLIVGVIILIIAMFFAHITIAHVSILIYFAVMTTVLFSLFGIMNGLYAKSFDDLSTVSTFVLTPLTYLGGVFFSASMLPGIFGKLVYINPIFYMINGFRYGFYGTGDTFPTMSIIVLFFITAAVLFLTHRLFIKGFGMRA